MYAMAETEVYIRVNTAIQIEGNTDTQWITGKRRRTGDAVCRRSPGTDARPRRARGDDFSLTRYAYPAFTDVASELKGGNSFRPTRDQRGLEQLAAAVGQPHEDIAQLLGISRNTLRARFSEELERGAAHANFKVGRKLFAVATGDPTLRTTLIAAIWWSKCRMGWRSPPVAGQAGNFGSKSEVQIVIVPQDQDRHDESAPLSDPDLGLPTVAGRSGGVVQRAWRRWRSGVALDPLVTTSNSGGEGRERAHG
jgi:hypothetical protein